LVVAQVTESVTVAEPVTGQIQPAMSEMKSDSVKTDAAEAMPEVIDQPVEDSIKTQIKNPDIQAPTDILITPGAEKKTEHIVQPKETLYAIAHLYNIGVMDLVNWNHLNIQDGIKPGQHLKLYSDEPVSEPIANNTSEQILHEVKTTDTLYSVARKYGVTIKDLMDWNGKKDFNLTVGEKLKIMRQ
jgi:membrane-bound lytic murein transglycosylase D